MLTRLEVDGFKSLQDFAVDLEPFTVFIGPNGAGKSNIFEALALLARLTSQPIAEAFKHGRGRSSDQFTRNPDGSTVKQMRFAIETLAYGHFDPEAGRAEPLAQSRFRYELTIARASLPSGAEQLVARDERLIAMRRGEDSWLTAHPEFRRYASHVEGGEVVFTALKGPEAAEPRIIGAPSRWPEERRVPPSHTALSQLTYDGALVLRRDLQQLRTLRPDAARLGEPSDPLESGALAEDGSNLPTILAGLPAPVLGAIRAELVALVPGVASFEVVPAAEQLRLDFELSGGEHTPARLVSDGTLRILLLLTALRLEPRPSLIAIEEPENGIYPGRLRALLELLRDEATRRHDAETLERLAEEVRAMGAQSVETNLLPTQILVSTHSPVVLAALRKHPQSLRFVDVVRRDGRRVTRLRGVGGATSTNRASISPREIDMLLQSARSEEP